MYVSCIRMCSFLFPSMCMCYASHVCVYVLVVCVWLHSRERGRAHILAFRMERWGKGKAYICSCQRQQRRGCWQGGELRMGCESALGGHPPAGQSYRRIDGRQMI